MNQYRSKEWKEFRDGVIARDGERCTKCGRGRRDGVILQVHHKRYVRGRRVWDYSPQDCITMCKGCHARDHGIIPDTAAWFKPDRGMLDSAKASTSVWKLALTKLSNVVQEPHQKDGGLRGEKAEKERIRNEFDSA